MKVYVAASARDARFTRICVASIRYFYPDIPISVLPGGPLQKGLADELRRRWNVSVAPIPRRDYGWGFVKLEPLFFSGVEKFLVVDSDTVFTGSILDLWPEGAAPFLVDDEPQSDADAKRLYYDWDRLRDIDPSARRPAFVFNTGQWFGTSGALTRDDFSRWIDWTFPRRLTHPDLFMPGDQGVLNYVLNREAALGPLCVDRRKIMRWPGHGMDGLDVGSVASRMAPPLIVHWAGMKQPRQRKVVGAELLRYFEEYYYAGEAGGSVKLKLRSLLFYSHELSGTFRNRARLVRKRIAGG